MEERIEDVMFPNNGELIVNGDEVTATIVDLELDPFECSFNNDMAVEIDTSKMNSIYLSIDNLEELIELVYDAQEKYREIFNNEKIQENE